MTAEEKVKRLERKLWVVQRIAARAAAGQLEAGPISALETIARYASPDKATPVNLPAIVATRDGSRPAYIVRGGIGW